MFLSAFNQFTHLFSGIRQLQMPNTKNINDNPNNMMIGFICNQIGSKDSNSPNSTEKRETALEPFPFQLIFVISSEVCFHHLLPGLVRDGDIGFQGLFDHLSRRTQVIDIQKITHFCPLQFDRSLSCNQLSINNFHSTHRTASSTQRRLFVDFFQGHLDRSRGHFFCIDRGELFDFDLLL